MKRIIYTLTLVLAALAFCEPAFAQRPLLQQAVRIVRQAQYVISEVSGVRQPAIYPAIYPVMATPHVVTPAQIVEPVVSAPIVSATPIVSPPVITSPIVSAPVVASSVVLDPTSAPVVVTGNSYDREAIRSMHILDRPNRAGHFYGNTVRRLHYTGRLLPTVR